MPSLVGTVQAGVPAGFDPENPPATQVHAVVERADGTGTTRRLHVRAKREVAERAGDRLIAAMADVVATGGVMADAVFFTDALAGARAVARTVEPDAFVRRFLNIPYDSSAAAGFTVAWGPLTAPGHMAAEAETVRLRLGNPHRDAVLGLLATHDRMNPAEGAAVPVGEPETPLTVLPFFLSGQAVLFGLYQAAFATILEFHWDNEVDDVLLSEPAGVRVERRWRERGLPVPATREQAIDTALHVVNIATAGFAPRLQLVDVASREPWAGHALPTILPALCVQLIRTVSLDRPWRECANATCGRFFTPRRSNQIYCPDAGCGHIMAKRRARERARRAA